MRLPQNEVRHAPCCRSSRQRLQNLVLISAALFLSAPFVDGFSSSGSSPCVTRRLHDVVKRTPSCRAPQFRLEHRSVMQATRIPSDSEDNIKSGGRKESPFRVRRRVRSVLRKTLRATPEDEVDTSWSRAGDRKESRLGVRRRVRSVLEKAKNRTGVQNSSEETLNKEQTALDVVAEAASIGGLGAVVTKEGTVDVALDFVQRNGNKRSNGNYSGYSAKNSVEQVSPPSRANPEDDFVVSSGTSASTASQRSTSPMVDVLKADVSAAFAMPADPLPFALPELTEKQQRLLDSGERVQHQSKMAREGSGFVVMDVKAPPYVVWECLLDFESYPETIPTVREIRLFTSTHLKSGYQSETPVDLGTGKATRHYGKPSITRAAFILSKFRLNIAAIHKYRPHPEGDYMVFTLDPASSNMVLQKAKGIWHTEANPDGKEGYTRVWLLCELRVSRMLPSFIVDYAAKRAMPRATTWLRPEVEAAAELWLKNEVPAQTTDGAN